MIPPKQRQTIKDTISSASSWTKSIASLGGQTLWIVSTSVLLLGAPWAMALAEDQGIAEEEHRMREQEAASQVSIINIITLRDYTLGKLILTYADAHIGWSCARKRRPVRSRYIVQISRHFLHCSIEGCYEHNKLSMDVYILHTCSNR
jgi:hypothetical protein